MSDADSSIKECKKDDRKKNKNRNKKHDELRRRRRLLKEKRGRSIGTRSVAKINEICCNKVTNDGKQMKRGTFISYDS